MRPSTLIACVAALLASPALSQPQTAPSEAAPAKKSSANRHHGKAAASSEEGPDLDAAAKREIPCPKGFVAEKSDGPHLTLTDKDKAEKTHKRRSKKMKGDEDETPAPKKHTLSRRCVPEAAPAKPAAP
jgi:hypothetical protein